MARPASYTSTAKSLHWLIVVLLLAQFIFAWTMPHIGRNTPVTTLISLHFTVGIIILAVAIVRLSWRAIHAEPRPLDGVPPWQVQSARIIHWLLYVLLFVLPILGWINASWRGMPIVMFGAELPKMGLDRRCAQFSGVLRNADADRPACCCGPLSLFHPPGRRSPAHAAGRLSIKASPSPFSSSRPRCAPARALRVPRFCALLRDPCK